MKGETKRTNKIQITTPSRLHFSLIDLNGKLGRIDGGFGLAINNPNFQIIAEPASDIYIQSKDYLDRATEIVATLKKSLPFPGINLRIVNEIPNHSGFGSGTQLSLAISTAVNELYNLNLTHPELTHLVGRGGTSGIGIAAYKRGGFIVDGGHKYPEQKASFLPSAAVENISPPPILARYTFPSWPLLIVIPNCRKIFGEEELELFRTLCPQPETVAPKLSHLLLLKILPSIIEDDVKSFGNALNSIQSFGWKKVEIDAQGIELKKTLAFLQDSGALGAGVSSWGPAICAVSDNIDRLRLKTENFLSTLPNGGTCFVTYANNKGVEIKKVD
ncbi:beta-ribofuranosylaminobenzene 5'-phosphate synthase [Candidatus Poribacteria bacterium]|nr:beta-ribofuranosylaminobenzene 5'-phosphate synthase [Candidatus Poribacteria bacterium]